MTNKRKCLDTKVVASPNAVHLVKFVHEYTKKGYEPVLNQVANVFGSISVCMALYEDAKESDLVGTNPTQDVNFTESTEVKDDGKPVVVDSMEDKEPDVESAAAVDEESDSGDVKTVEDKPKPRTRAKPKSKEV